MISMMIVSIDSNTGSSSLLDAYDVADTSLALYNLHLYSLQLPRIAYYDPHLTDAKLSLTGLYRTTISTFLGRGIQ